MSTQCNIELSRFQIGDTELRYRTNPESGRVELALAPAGSPDRITIPDETLVPLADIKIRGDHNSCDGSAGRTMRENGSTELFRFRDQKSGEREILTILADSRGHELIHRLSWRNEIPVFTVQIEFRNLSDQPVVLDMIESFALGGIGPGTAEEQSERVKLHRFRSSWSGEAFHVCDMAEELHIERSRSGASIRCERFGQIGTMSVWGFHPFAAVEDISSGVFYGAQLAWAGSWQIEFSRYRNYGFSLSGGLADREFGHWSKCIAPGESFFAPEAFLACSNNGFDALCNRLLAEHEARLDVPESEEDLPLIFNDWCTNWGNQTEKNILAIADKLRNTPVRYFVIDAGWFKTSGSEWFNSQGDWIPNREFFPDGIRATVERLRERGFLPGIWFEFEVCGPRSQAFTKQAKHHLTLDGIPIFTDRHFWNLNDPEAIAYLEKHFVQMLRENGFGYAKIDCNDTVGFGCDNPDSPGEGVRCQVLGIYRMFRRLREVMPDLVVENSAGGGLRLEPSMFALSSMSSFSDAQEEPESPVIAASLHRLMLPRQCLIWAVVRPEHDLKKLVYILSSAMLGRFCLSGDILGLSPDQWDLTCRAMEFYQRLVPVLKHGSSMLITNVGPAWRQLSGYQILIRRSVDGTEAILFLHVFNNPPSKISYSLPPGEWQIIEEFYVSDTGNAMIVGNDFRLDAPAAMSGRVIRIRLMNKKHGR